MTYTLVLVGLVVGGFVGTFVIHFVFFVAEFMLDDHYLTRFFKISLNLVPGPLLLVVVILLMGISGMVFMFMVLAALDTEDVTILSAYLAGVGIYLVIVPFRVTFIPLILDCLFPGRQRDSE